MAPEPLLASCLLVYDLQAKNVFLSFKLLKEKSKEVLYFGAFLP